MEKNERKEAVCRKGDRRTEEGKEKGRRDEKYLNVGKTEVGSMLSLYQIILLEARRSFI